MYGQYTYLIYVLAFSFVAIGLFWLASFRFLRQNWRVIAMTAFSIFVYMCVVDPFAEAWHNWFFSNDRLLGWWMINFPVEEGLFFFLVPIAVASATLSFIYFQERTRWTCIWSRQIICNRCKIRLNESSCILLVEVNMQVTKNILIHGSLERVFDTVTTAKYWIDWHPATLGVSGAIDHPMQLGNKIRERAKIGGIVAENDWTVTEHLRPTHVVLRMPGTRFGDLEIAYTFALRGDAVEFTRELQFDLTNLPPTLDRVAIERQMDSDSEEALKRLKVLVEKLVE